MAFIRWDLTKVTKTGSYKTLDVRVEPEFGEVSLGLMTSFRFLWDLARLVFHVRYADDSLSGLILTMTRPENAPFLRDSPGGPAVHCGVASCERMYRVTHHNALCLGHPLLWE